MKNKVAFFLLLLFSCAHKKSISLDDFRDLPCVYDANTLQKLPDFGQVSVQYVERFIDEVELSSEYDKLTLINLTRYGERTLSFSLSILTDGYDTNLIVYDKDFSVINSKKITGFNVAYFLDEMRHNVSSDTIYRTQVVVIDVGNHEMNCYQYKDVNSTYFNRILSLEAFH